MRPDIKEKAVKQLKRLCETYDRTFLLLQYLADLHLKDKDYNSVLEIYKIMSAQSLHPEQVLKEGCRLILKVKGDYSPAQRLLADTLFSNEEWAEAEQSYLKYIETTDDEDNEVYLKLFKIYDHLGMNDKLIEVGANAIRADAYNMENYKILIKSLMRNEQFQEAMNWLMKAKNIDTHDDEIFKLIRKVDVNLKRDRMGELRDLIQKYPDNTDYHFEFADICLIMGRLDDAILHFQKAAQKPLLANVSKAKLALALARRGMFDLAEETLAEVKLEVNSGDDFREIKSVYYDIAGEFDKEKIRDKALKYYKEVFRVDAGFRNVVGKIERLQDIVGRKR
jgi:tetratricopeptide (TPR) repeat protein